MDDAAGGWQGLSCVLVTIDADDPVASIEALPIARLPRLSGNPLAPPRKLICKGLCVDTFGNRAAFGVVIIVPGDMLTLPPVMDNVARPIPSFGNNTGFLANRSIIIRQIRGIIGLAVQDA